MADIVVLKSGTTIGGEPRKKGWEGSMPEFAASALAVQGKIRIVDDAEFEEAFNDRQAPPSEDEEEENGEQDTPPVQLQIEWTDVDGIGPSTADQIRESFDEMFPDVTSAEELLGEDLTRLPGVGESTAKDLVDYLEAQS